MFNACGIADLDNYRLAGSHARFIVHMPPRVKNHESMILNDDF